MTISEKFFSRPFSARRRSPAAKPSPILPASILPQFPGVVKGEKRYFRPPPPPDKTRNLYKEKQKDRQKFRLPVLADIRRCADIPL